MSLIEAATLLQMAKLHKRTIEPPETQNRQDRYVMRGHERAALILYTSLSW